ncbi:MAG: hypothetical protein IID54_00085 [Proteobacteria bacterium]|nr:hypothetical protein [Pseudomonadota bacterium]
MTSPTTSTIDAKLFAIGVLSVTACVLFVGFLLTSMTPTPAYGIGQNDRGGDYIMLTQQISTSVEGIIVIDAASKRLVMYRFDINKKSIQDMAILRLDRLPGPGRRGG